MGLNPFLGMAMKFLGNTASQGRVTGQRTEPVQKPETALEQVNLAVSEQGLKQLNAPELIATAPSAAAIMPEVLHDNRAEPLNAFKQQGEAASAIKLEISQKAVETLKPILLAFKGLVKSLLLGNEDAYSAVRNFLLANEDILKPVRDFLLQNEGIVKPILLNLSQANSNPANAQAVPNPA